MSASWFYTVVMNISDVVKIWYPLYYKEPKLLPLMSAVPRKLRNKLVKFQITLQSDHREESSTLRDWRNITWYSRAKKGLTKKNSDPVLFFPIKTPWLHDKLESLSKRGF